LQEVSGWISHLKKEELREVEDAEKINVMAVYEKAVVGKLLKLDRAESQRGAKIKSRTLFIS
jgi:hypothetical protein